MSLQSLLALLLLLLALALPGPLLAENRGAFSLDIRAAADPNAPVAETVELYKSSYALVIGNDAYAPPWPRLANAVADAEEIGALLEEQGFEVTLKTDLDSDALNKAIKEFFVLRGSDPDARLLLWYAGHGHSIDGEGFLVPVDAPDPADPAFALQALHMRTFGSDLRLARAKHVLAIFDSCFSGTIFRTRAGPIPPAITHATTKPTRQLLTSGDAGQVVSDDGTFRKLFVSALRGETTADANGDNYLTASELGIYLTDEVTNRTTAAQTPRHGKLLDADFVLGDFIFQLPERRLAASLPAPGTDDADGEVAGAEALMAEMELWTSVLFSEDPEQVRSYLETYPEGRFAGPAQSRVEELEARIAAEAEQEVADGAAADATDGLDEIEATDPEAEASAEIGDTDAPADDAVAEADAAADGVETEGAPAPDLPALELAGGINLTTVAEGTDNSWVPVVEANSGAAFKLPELRTLPEGFLGSAAPATALSATAPVGSRKVGPQGYSVAPDAWTFSDPQGDSRYQVDGNWIHIQAPANHNIWHCDRNLAPILSVPAPRTGIWSAQTWFQLPARIGASHVGIVVWNGVEADGPTRALYFGPSDTRDLGAAGSFRGDCTGGAGDLSGLPGSDGPFNLEYSGGRGWLRVSKSGDRLTFYFKSPHMHNWRQVGSMLTEGKDDLVHVGLIAKTWGGEPVIASFSDFRVIPGHAGVETWTPAYYDRLAQENAVRFSGEDFADFEWNDPNGDSIHQITEDRISIKASGGRSIWNCDRGSAPILSVDVPQGDRWSAEVDFDLPARIGASHTGLVLWNDEFESAPVHALYFGPSDTSDLGVAGSNPVDCTSGAGDLRRQAGSEGPFNIYYPRGKGRLRIARTGERVSFFFKAPERRNWEQVGTVLATARDNFTKIGLIGKTWGSEPLTAEFSNFRILSGETVPEQWFPSYFARLRTGEPMTFVADAFADFEWSDPDGNSVHEIRGSWVRLTTTGGHNGVWDCRRNTAPLLTLPVPPREAWVAQVRYRVPERAGATAAGLALWNAAEHGTVRLLRFGPVETKGLSVSGSYSDDCTASPSEIARQEGNTGVFEVGDGGSEGILQIVKFGWVYKFSHFEAATGEWTELGALEATVKDDFRRIGLTIQSWGSNPIAVEFRDFTLVPGLHN